MNLSVLGAGILLGLGAAAPIGPVNVEIARRSLRFGFLAGFALGCGAVTVDVAYAVVSCLGVRPMLNYPQALRIIGLAGGLLLVYLAAMSFRSAARPHIADGQGAAAVGSHTSYITGVLMTSLNPMTLLFWFIAVPGTLGQIAANAGHDLPIACAGVFVAALAWVCFFAGLMSFVGRKRNQGWLRLADLLGGFLLLGFAGVAIWHAAMR
jgi:L-lysine exporter family protein LysE/ArgO